ncbi:MAG: hypothetical protein JWR35_1315 [Marmoricola sp.]|jgi:hypothetical protein|nr:hypothetical protein [Marmoricola sp.]
MFRLEEVMVPLITILWLYCILDAIMTPDGAARNLPKAAWIFVVLLFPLVGSIAWLAAGKPEKHVRTRSAYERSASAFPEYDRPGRAAAQDPKADEDFLKKVRERAEAQREVERQRRRDRENDGT